MILMLEGVQCIHCSVSSIQYRIVMEFDNIP